MEVREIGSEQCLQILADAKVARLACALANQPYVIPVCLAYHQPAGAEPCLYGLTTQGQKDDWMRANPSVCIEVDEISGMDQWISVVAFGRYEELSNGPD